MTLEVSRSAAETLCFIKPGLPRNLSPVTGGTWSNHGLQSRVLCPQYETLWIVLPSGQTPANLSTSIVPALQSNLLNDFGCINRCNIRDLVHQVLEEVTHG